MARRTKQQLIDEIIAYLKKQPAAFRSKIMAIKRLRELSGMGLADAKEWIEKQGSVFDEVINSEDPPAVTDPAEFARDLRERGAPQLATMVEENDPVLHVRRELQAVIDLAKKRGVRVWVMEDGAGTELTSLDQVKFETR